MELTGMDMYTTLTHVLIATLQSSARFISPFMDAMNRSTVNMHGSGLKEPAITNMLLQIILSSFIHRYFSISIFTNGHALI